MIAQGLALKSPERVRGLVLCDTAAKIGTYDAWDERIEAIRSGGLKAIADGIDLLPEFRSMLIERVRLT
jgi:3-oxoadipate enol-lactonase